MKQEEELRVFAQEEYIKRLDCQLRFLIEKYSIETIAKSIVTWLRENNINYFDLTTFARDFYIGSDLTAQEKALFYHKLKNEGFFQLLNSFLYSNDFSICSWTIYTIGKFSEYENSTLLEAVYETRYKEKNPLLSYRCLNELSWLNSEKTKDYLEELEQTNTIIAKLIQLYYWETYSDNSKFDTIINKKEYLNLIVPNEILSENKNVIEERLFSFENYLTNLYIDSKKIYMTNFEIVVMNYFQNLT